MTDAERDFWQTYINMLSHDLGLLDWDIRVERDEPRTESANGAMVVWFSQKRASMRLNRELILETSPEGRWDQRQVIIHELLHCHFDQMQDAVSLAFPGRDDARVELFREYHNRALELCLDGIATAIAPLLPLPCKDSTLA